MRFPDINALQETSSGVMRFPDINAL